MNTRETILDILREHKMVKVIEIALQMWLRVNLREVPSIWRPTPEELAEIQKIERLLVLFLPQMLEDGIIDTDYKHVRLKEVK